MRGSKEMKLNRKALLKQGVNEIGVSVGCGTLHCNLETGSLTVTSGNDKIQVLSLSEDEATAIAGLLPIAVKAAKEYKKAHPESPWSFGSTLFDT